MAVGLAMTAGSIYMKAQAAQKQKKERKKAMSAESDRQSDLQSQREARLSQTMKGMGADEQRRSMDEEADRRTGELQSQMTMNEDSAATDYVPVSSGTPALVGKEAAKSFSSKLKAGKEEAKRLGALGSWSPTLQGAQTDLMRSGQDVGRISNFMRGSQAVLPSELAAANEAGGGMMQMGDLLGAGGSMLMKGGMLGPAGGAAGAMVGPRYGTSPGGFYTSMTGT